MSAISPEQQKIYNNKIFSFDIEVASCKVSGDNLAVGDAIAGTLSQDKVPETLRSKIIKAADEIGVPAGAIAGLYLTEQNGFPFYQKYYNNGGTKDETAFSSISKDGAYWQKAKYDSDTWAKNTAGRGFSGPFQFGSTEWQTYGNGGDISKFDDSVVAAARYMKVLVDNAKKSLGENTSESKLISEAARNYNGQTGAGIDGRKIQEVYGDQVALIASALSTGGNAATGVNTASSGQQVFNQAQLDAISANQKVYEEAANAVDIPWQMIAVIHVRETGLKRENPGNGQGIYQFVSGVGGPYPSGPVDDTEFLRQTKIAADFIKNKATSTNYTANKVLTKSSSLDVIKDTFFSYNGRAAVYAEQAATLGFSADTQGYEGSPYVMNRADAKRDPATNPSGWGQIKRDYGPIEYPSNNDYGAFVQYGALTGAASAASAGDDNCINSEGQANSTSVNCSGPANTTAGLSPIRQSVVCLAQQELALWESGKMKPGGGDTGFHKYSLGADEDWCADFTSWLYNQAKKPLSNSENGKVSSVGYGNPSPSGQWGIGLLKTNGFDFKAAGTDYIPRPGDLVIYKGNGVSHVNMVVAVSGTIMTTIGGNQGNSDQQGAFYMGSKVSKNDRNGFTGGNIQGYVIPD